MYSVHTYPCTPKLLLLEPGYEATAMHACLPSARHSRVRRASGSKYSDSLFTRRLILTLISRSPLKSPDTNVPGFSIRFHWICVNERPKRIEIYSGFREFEAV